MGDNTNMITISNLRISSISTRRIITNGGYDDNHEILISEYNMDEILDITKEEFLYYPKKIYSILLPHMFEIIKRRGYHRKTIFCFSLYQNCDNPHDYQAMFKDIEVEVNGFEAPLNTVFNDIKDCVDDMEDGDEVEFVGEEEEDVRLVFIKTEILKKK